MNYGELKEQAAKYAHRTDLNDQMDVFVRLLSERLGRRFGVMPAPLIADTDTNSLLNTHSGVYLYGVLKEIAIFTHNIDAMDAHERDYQREVSELNINYRGLDWDACCSPVMARAECN